MSTFFSGTDTSTLLEEGKDRNHFVSLIVNNEGKYTAAITRRVNSKGTKSISYKTFDNQVVESTEENNDSEEIEWFNLNIEFDSSSLIDVEELDKRLEDIKKLKEEKTPITTVVSNTPSTYFNKSYKDSYYGDTLFKDSDFKFPEPKHFDFNMIDCKEPIEESSTLNTKNIVDDIFMNLMTGSVLTTKDSKHDQKKWLSNMDQLFDRKFMGDKDPSLTTFNYWATNYIDSLFFIYSIDLEIKDEDILFALWSDCLIEKFLELPDNNKYINEYINILTAYGNK